MDQGVVAVVLFILGVIGTVLATLMGLAFRFILKSIETRHIAAYEKLNVAIMSNKSSLDADIKVANKRITEIKEVGAILTGDIKEIHGLIHKIDKSMSNLATRFGEVVIVSSDETHRG